MTNVVYDPAGGWMEFRGHAGAGEKGRDIVCAALSILMYTLIASVPGAEVKMGDGWCHIEGGAEPGPYGIISTGVRLLAQQYPRHVRMEVRM